MSPPGPRNPVERFFQLSMLGMLASGYGAILSAGALDMATALPSGLALAARLLTALGLARLSLSDGLASALALAYIGFFPIDYLYLSREFLPATVHLVFFVASLLVLKARSMREFRFLQIAAFLQMMAAAVLSLNAAYFAFLAFFLLCGAGAMASGEIRSRLLSEPRAARVTLAGARRGLAFITLCSFAGILAVGAGFFLLLPRTARAAMQHLVPGRFHLPGFSNQVSLGAIGEIRMTSTPVMHIRIHNSPPGAELKWRGMTLAQFDGTKWFNETGRADPIPVENKRAILAPLDQLSQPGRRLQYEVQLKSPAGDALFFAGLPEQISIDAPRILRTAAGSFRTEGFSPPMRYAASSFLESRDHPVHDRDLAPGWRGVYLQLPPIDPRVAQLAQRLTARETSDEGRGLALERFLQTAFAYTAELPKQPVPDPIAHFLFERRKGHCEYFASAMALMLRTLGIPSRLATGFQSGLYNPVSDWYLIRASDAHSWVEAWIPNRGWVTFDPTPPDLRPPDTGLLARAALYLDALEVFWQDWVMSYDLERQILLADRVSRGGWNVTWSWSAAADSARRAWRAYAVPWGPWILAAFLLGQIVYWLLLPLLPRAWRAWKRRREEARIRAGAAHSADAALLYQRLLDALKQHGVEKPAWMTPREFARTLGHLPARSHAERATDAYHEWRHAGRPEAAPRMLDALADLEESLRR